MSIGICRSSLAEGSLHVVSGKLRIQSGPGQNWIQIIVE